MARIRVAAIIPMQGGYAFMYRKNVTKRKDIQNYYTFPGGGLEQGETLEEGVKREVEEEFGIEVEIEKLLFETYSEKFKQKEYYFLCKYVGGEFGTGTGPEFSHDPNYIDSGEYIPKIVESKDIEKIILLPEEIKEKFIDYIKKV